MMSLRRGPLVGGLLAESANNLHNSTIVEPFRLGPTVTWCRACFFCFLLSENRSFSRTTVIRSFFQLDSARRGVKDNLHEAFLQRFLLGALHFIRLWIVVFYFLSFLILPRFFSFLAMDSIDPAQAFQIGRIRSQRGSLWNPAIRWFDCAKCLLRRR